LHDFAGSHGFFLGVISGRRKGVAAAALRCALHPAAIAYGAFVRRRNASFDRGAGVHKVDVPVISVGNITTGGTGKTVLVEDIARRLLSEGLKPVIISRGYGGDRSGTGGSDEVLLLAENLPDVPHLTGGDRVDVARRAVAQFRPDAIVLDDGFSHRALARDLDVVTVDALCPFGFGRLLPRGLLREPPDALSRADLVVLTRSDAVDGTSRGEITRQIREYAGHDRIVPARHDVRRIVDMKTGKPVAAASLDAARVAVACAIGNPRAFELTVESLGARIVASATFRDHHVYIGRDLAAIDRCAKNAGADRILVTQKDRVKLAKIGYNWMLSVCSVEVRMGYPDGDGLLDELISRALGAR